MNRQTRQYRKLNLSFVVQKGQNNSSGAVKGFPDLSTCCPAVLTQFERVKGRCVNSSREREASGRKPFRGAMAKSNSED